MRNVSFCIRDSLGGFPVIQLGVITRMPEENPYGAEAVRALRPIRAVERAVLDGLGDVLGLDVRGGLEVSYGARDL